MDKNTKEEKDLRDVLEEIREAQREVERLNADTERKLKQG